MRGFFRLRPIDPIYLRQCRNGKRLRHALQLNPARPPNLHSVRHRRIERGRDRIDDRRKAVRSRAAFTVDFRIPDRTRLRLVDVAGDGRIDRKFLTRRQSRNRSATQPDERTDTRQRFRRKIEPLRIRPQNRFDRQKPNVVVAGDFQQRPPGPVGHKAVIADFAGMVGDVAEIFLPFHDLGGVVFRNLDAAPRHVGPVAAHELYRIGGPVDEIFIDLERPGNALPIDFHPVDLRLVARGVVRRTQSKNAAVLRTVRIGSLVLVKIRSFAVAFRRIQMGRRGRQPRNAVAAPRRLEFVANRGYADISSRPGDFDRLHVDDAMIGCGRIVVDHDHLTLQFAGGVERFLGGRFIDVKAAEHDIAVRSLVADRRAGRFLAHHLRQNVGRTKQFHVLARQIDRPSAIARIGPENVLRARAGNRRGDNDVRIGRQSAVRAGDYPGKLRGFSADDIDGLVDGVEKKIVPNAFRRIVNPVGFVPIDALRGEQLVAEIVKRLVALGRKARCHRVEPANRRRQVGRAVAFVRFLRCSIVVEPGRWRHKSIRDCPRCVNRFDRLAAHGHVERRRARRNERIDRFDARKRQLRGHDRRDTKNHPYSNRHRLSPG